MFRPEDDKKAERNHLVRLLASIYPSGVARTDIPGWHPQWHGCVYIDFPWGQASWHFHDSQAHLFEGLPPYKGTHDGHSTEQKYQAIRDVIRRGALDGISQASQGTPGTTQHASPKVGPWKCFHCGEVFTDEVAAAEHFGTMPTTPGCQINLREYRRMEDLVRRHEREDTNLHRAAQAAQEQLQHWRARAERAEALLNTPSTKHFATAVVNEAAHQSHRWPAGHDEGKSDLDWYWLIAHLAEKATHNPPNEMPPTEAKLHRIIAIAAACAHWHAAVQQGESASHAPKAMVTGDHG